MEHGNHSCQASIQRAEEKPNQKRNHGRTGCEEIDRGGLPFLSFEIFRCETKKDVEERIREFNKLIDVVIETSTKPKDGRVKALAAQLDNIVSKKRSKEVAEAMLKDGLEGVTVTMKIDKKEFASKFK